MKVTLKHYTPLHICSEAIRTCWQSQDKSDTPSMEDFVTEQVIEEGFVSTRVLPVGPKDRELIDRVANKFRHASTLEHLSYNFQIEGISRACLQELARHRVSSFSVKSSRYTLKELKSEHPFTVIKTHDSGWSVSPEDKTRSLKYLMLTGNSFVDKMSIIALENLRQALDRNISNDIAKYCLPESYKTELSWTINARSLQNFLTLRSSKAALWEIRDLAQTIFNALPEDHKYLFEGCMYESSKSNT